MLDEGDVVWVDFDPVQGSEQGGIRPALVLTSAIFHETRTTAIVCPITRNTSPWPTKVFLPKGSPVAGAVLAEQVRVVDRGTRGFRRVGRVPERVLAEVREKLAALVGINIQSSKH